MFFLIGFGQRLIELGAGSKRTCPRCHNTTTWQRVRAVQQLTLFFIPVARWGRHDLEMCPVCHESIAAPARQKTSWLRRAHRPVA